MEKHPKSPTIIELCTEAAEYTSSSPHDFILAAMQGKPINQTITREVYDDDGQCIGVELTSVPVYPSPKDRLECAKALLPYTMARLSVQVVQQSADSNETLANIKALSDTQLFEQLRTLQSTLGIDDDSTS